MTLHPNLHVLESQGVHHYVEAILGARAYLVGGGVRDELMGGVCDDYDFTTNMLPEEIEEAIRREGRKPLLMGKRHGTIAFVTPDGSTRIEVTSHRTETYEPASRQPIAVFGCSLNEDLLRRDFTINAIARRSDGRIVDPYNGREDLENKVLRSVDTPKRMFREDPIRLLRAARFASRFGFEVEEKTLKGMKDTAHRILMPARERILPELDKILLTPQPYVGLDLLAQTRVLNFVIPELALQVDYDQNSKYHDWTLWEHTNIVVGLMPQDDLILRWAALLHDVAKPFVREDKPGRSTYVKHDMLGSVMVLEICKRLRMSNDRAVTIAALVNDHLDDDSPLKWADDMAKRRTA